MAEFYEKYVVIKTKDGFEKPVVTQSDIDFLNMVEKARKEGKDIIKR